MSNLWSGSKVLLIVFFMVCCRVVSVLCLWFCFRCSVVSWLRVR